MPSVTMYLYVIQHLRVLQLDRGLLWIREKFQLREIIQKISNVFLIAEIFREKFPLEFHFFSLDSF